MSDKQKLLEDIMSSFGFLVNDNFYVLHSFEYYAELFGNFIALYKSNAKNGINISISLHKSQIFVYIASVKKPKTQYDLFHLVKLIKEDGKHDDILLPASNYWDEEPTVAGQIGLAAKQLNSILIFLQELFCKKNYKLTVKRLHEIKKQYEIEMKSIFDKMEQEYIDNHKSDQ